MIELIDLSKQYGRRLALQGLHLRFEQGKTYGIVGENGAGKTTLFRCLAGLESHEGEIRSPFAPPLKDHLVFLPTEPYFFDKMTGREYIQLHCNARGTRVDDLDRRNVFDLPLDQYAVAYSTGMKKKLALTAILLQPAELYILDEPFNGVDVQSNMVISEVLDRLHGMGKTILISSHIFSTLRDCCQEIMLLKDGRVLRQVGVDDFDDLERQMRDFSVGDRVERLFEP